MATAKTAYVMNTLVAEVGGQSAALQAADLPRIDWPQATVSAAASSRRAAALIGNARLGELALDVALSEAGALLDWVQALMRRQPVERDGALIEVDRNFREQRRLEWTSGQIVEAAFDALDASAAKVALGLKLRVQPQALRYRSGGGAAVALAMGKRKAWLASNFRVEVGSLPGPAVSKVELPRITAKLATETGTSRSRRSAVSDLAFGALTLSFGAAGRDPLRKLAAQWLTGDLTEVPATVVVELLDAALKKPQARLTFEGCTLLAFEERLGGAADQTGGASLSLQPAAMSLQILT